MKKIFKALICAGLVGAIAAGTFGAAGCTKKPGAKRNPETDPLRLSIGAVDEKFNPMFYTAQNDGEIAGLTQVSLITTDAEGKLRVGNDYPTVALDYLETYYSEDGTVLATGNGREVKAAPGGNMNGDPNGTTSYEFLIKNGMKFSDGEPLTVLDVLFNLYVYLDPAYSGSSTIYSTRILGLQQYRQQDKTAGEDSNLSTATYYARAQRRIQDVLDYANGDISLTAQITADTEAIKDQYKKNLESDWKSVSTSWAETYKNYYFTSAWQAFYYEENAIDNQYKMNEQGANEQVIDEQGKYLTEFDPDHITGIVSSRGQEFTNGINEAVTEEAINDYMSKNENVSRENAELALQGKHVVTHLSTTRDVKYILNYTYTNGQVLDTFMLEEMTKDTEGKEMTVENISGITVGHTADSKYNNVFNGKTYTEDYDVLKVTIRGVDPKAKWNFGFSVAPLHYYSGSWDNVDYKQLALDEYAHRNDPDGTFYDGKATHFGVKFRDINYFNKVLGNDAKSGLPIGAGAYKCCNYQFGSSGLNSGTFFYNNMAFFERNPYFETMGEGVENAIIKYVTYQVTRDDAIVQRLQAGEIDYGEPTATAKNQGLLRGFEQIRYLAGGYGYVGINPKYVTDIDIRRGIMTAFDTSPIMQYYGMGLVNVINRPMSTTSWAYPWQTAADGGQVDIDPYYPAAETSQAIIDVIEDGGKWVYNTANNTWRTRDNSITNRKFKYSFTIAGETTDHPAFDMFIDARNTLAGVGFDISVETDQKALQKLVTGDLAVWAAAWSSSIDPDPYQIYSINSNASSTRNWYKDGIVSSGANGDYSEEYRIANELNDLIMQGRRTLVESDRKDIYADCLDLIMELAVEFPTYQRYNLCVFNSSVLDMNTMYTNRTGVGLGEASFNMAPLGQLWKVNYVK